MITTSSRESPAGRILDGGAVGTSLDVLVDLLAQIEDNDGNPTHWLLSPTAWASLRKIKTGTGLPRRCSARGPPTP
ncbi:MAG: hypothetical protein HY829_15500 [Actinobacteria bacterium]|nr:hypothetical protein [Actinomycetota bacterium]